jgi:hypothetical protein
MEPTSLALAARHVPVASWARRRAAVAVLKSGRGSSASRWAAWLSQCGILPDMRIATGKVVHGKLELEGDALEEGATVTVLVPETDETFEFTPEEELALEESLKQAAQGHFVDAEALLRELRQ